MLKHAVTLRRYLSLFALWLVMLGLGCSNAGSDRLPSEQPDDAGAEVDAGGDGTEDAGGDTGASDAGAEDAGRGADAAPDAGTDAGSDASTDTDDASDAVGGSEADADASDASSDASQDASEPSSSTPDFLNKSNTRALWLWADADTSKAFLDNRWQMRDDLMQLAGAPHGKSSRSLNRIFFEARTYSRDDIYDDLRSITYDPLLESNEQAKLRKFNKKAHDEGVAIEYLDGQAIWLASDTNAEWPKDVCEDVVTFNETTNDVEERFAGIHFDIEPHTVQSGPWGGDWWEDKLPDGYNADWTRRFKEIMNSCRATLDDYKARTGHHMTLTVDLGADYAYYNKPLLDFFNGSDTPVDYVTIMNYYDNQPNQDGDPSYFYGWHDGEAMTGGVIQNLDLWTDVPVLFGMETGPTAIADDYQSFYQEGYNEMYSVVDTLIDDYSGPGMLGVAFHPWGSFKDMDP